MSKPRVDTIFCCARTHCAIEVVIGSILQIEHSQNQQVVLLYSESRIWCPIHISIATTIGHIILDKPNVKKKHICTFLPTTKAFRSTGFKVCITNEAFVLSYNALINIYFSKVNIQVNVCRRSNYPFCIVSYYIKWVTTSWTYSI